MPVILQEQNDDEGREVRTAVVADRSDFQP
jgi:hypothetical protein